jgi:hypothetical protein
MSQNVLLSIINGEADNDLDAIIQAVRTRRQSLASLNVSSLHVGDTVHFSAEIRPRYLIGLPATVVKINPKSITVNCPDDADYGRFQGSKNVRCPNSLIQGR